MAAICIRPAQPQDCAKILSFIQALADYERASDSVVADRALLERTLFGPTPDARALICEQQGEAVGFAVYFFSYSTWRAQRGLFLEDLYVDPGSRGHGIGRALLAHLAWLAQEQGCARFEWNVLDWNQPAIELYRAVGAQPQQEWTTWRLEGEALGALAANHRETAK